MLSFYNIDVEYVNYLRQFDARVPYIKYADRNKFVCGVVLSINDCDYFAPISSQTHKQQTALLIRDRDDSELAAIKFNFMFPAPRNVISMISIPDVRKSDPAYASLLQKEYEFCRSNESEILTKARKVYSIGCRPSHFLYSTCCDFRLLEEKSRIYLTGADNLK